MERGISMSPREGGLSRRQVLQRGVVAAAGVTLLPGVLASCGSDSGADVSDVTWSTVSGPPDLNPLRRFDIEGAMILSLALEGLVKFDEDFKIVPALAQDWERASLTEYVYRLRDGLEFSDGTPLRIDDVVYSLARHLTSPESAFAFFYGNVAEVRARGTTDVVFTLKEPDALFEYTPAHTAGLIYSKAAAQEVGSRFGTPNGLPVGTGPFTLLEYAQGDQVSLERNAAYREDRPAVQRLTSRAIPEPSSRLLAMRSGEIDGTYDVPPEQFSQWEDLDNATVQKAEGLGVVYLIFNVSKAPWTDIHVRRALAYSVDREGLVQSAIDGAGEVATAFIPPRFWESLDLSKEEVLERYSKFPQYPFDPERAHSELGSSASRDGFSVTVAYPSSDQRLGKLLLNLKENVAPLGIEINVKEITLDQWFTRLYGHRSELGLEVQFYRPDYPDPANYATFFASDQIDGGNNFSSYRNRLVDRLLAEQRVQTDPADRIDPLMEVLEITAMELPIFPIWWESSNAATRSGLTVDPSPVYYLQPWAATIRSS